MENIKDGICQTLKSSKHFITLISMLRTLYFVYIFYTTKKCKEKVYISVHFLMILDHQKPGSIPSAYRQTHLG